MYLIFSLPKDVPGCVSFISDLCVFKLIWNVRPILYHALEGIHKPMLRPVCICVGTVSLPIFASAGATNGRAMAYGPVNWLN